MSRSGVAITAAVIVLIVTGTLASHMTNWFDFRARQTFWDSQQRPWNVATSSDVKIEVDDSSGNRFGVGGDENRIPTNDPIVEVRVAAVDTTIHGMGRHEIRDTAGRLLGAVILSGWSTPERARMAAQTVNFIPPRDYNAFVAWSMQRDKAGGSGRGNRGVDSMGPIAWGYDWDSGLFWCVRGLGSIDLGSVTIPHVADVNLAPVVADCTDSLAGCVLSLRF